MALTWRSAEQCSTGGKRRLKKLCRWLKDGYVERQTTMTRLSVLILSSGQQLRQRPRSSDIVLQNEKKTVGSPLSKLYLYTLRVWRNMSNGNLSRKNEAVGREATASSCLNVARSGVFTISARGNPVFATSPVPSPPTLSLPFLRTLRSRPLKSNKGVCGAL